MILITLYSDSRDYYKDLIQHQSKYPYTYSASAPLVIMEQSGEGCAGG